MGEIIGICTTNLDEYKREQWPTKFCRCPVKRELVQARSGQRLHVVGITHMESGMRIGHYKGPHIEVELHKVVGG